MKILHRGFRRAKNSEMMIRARLTAEKIPPARRAASSRENGRSDVSHTGVAQIYRIEIGIAHTANFSHDLKISRGTNERIITIGRK